MLSQLRKDSSVSPPMLVKSTMFERQQQNYVLPFMKDGDEGIAKFISDILRTREKCAESSNSDGSSPQRREKGWHSYPENYGKWNTDYGLGEYTSQFSHFWKKNGHGEMRDGWEDSQLRHAPYRNRQSKSRVKLRKEDQIHITVWRGRKVVMTERQKKEEKETQGKWFKITILNGVKYEKTCLVDLLQSYCRVPFTPVDFHYVHNRARFFIQDAIAASILREASYKIYDEENKKVCVFVNQSSEPYSVWNMLEPEQLELLELAMKKRYDDSQQALDLQSLRHDADLVAHNIDIILNRRSCMAATLQIISKNFPELLSLNLRCNKLYQLDGLSDIVQMVPTIKILNLSNNMLKSTWELNKIKGLKLEELQLHGNPLCDTFEDQSSYVSSILELFPKLLRLDSLLLSDLRIQVHRMLPTCKGSLFGSKTPQNLVLQFLQHYYWIYDYGDRKNLLKVYNDHACFSLTFPFNTKTSSNTFWNYMKDSKNTKKLKDQYLRYQLMKHTKFDIVGTLCMLPQTQHDLSSFLLDMWIHTDTMLCFSIHGMFKEVEEKSPASVRAFTRTFTATPASSTLCIVNDEIVVKDTTVNDTQNVFSVSMPKATSPSVPLLSRVQCIMAKPISTSSEMNPDESHNHGQDSKEDVHACSDQKS